MTGRSISKIKSDEFGPFINCSDLLVNLFTELLKRQIGFIMSKWVLLE